MLERSIVDVSGIAVRNRIEEGRHLPSHIVEVIEPVEEVALAVELERIEYELVR